MNAAEHSPGTAGAAKPKNRLLIHCAAWYEPCPDDARKVRAQERPKKANRRLGRVAVYDDLPAEGGCNVADLLLSKTTAAVAANPNPRGMNDLPSSRDVTQPGCVTCEDMRCESHPDPHRSG